MCVYVYVKQIMKMEVGKVHNMLGNVKQIMKMEVGKAHTADSSQIMRRKQIYPKGPEGGGGIGGIGGIGGGGIRPQDGGEFLQGCFTRGTFQRISSVCENLRNNWDLLCSVLLITKS